MRDSIRRTRRDLLRATAVTGAGLLASACARLGMRAWPGEEKRAEEISPAEDLMREHGVLDRLLLVYEEGLRRLDTRRPLSPRVLRAAAGLVRRFIEDYHEKLEEDYVFPYLEKAGKLVDLVAVLRQQHQRSRALTAKIERASTPGGKVDRAQLVASMRLFIRMYRPHAAREDTVLFPAFRELVTEGEYRTLGETFEDRERSLFGPRGFEAIVDEVARLERELGIHDLAAFTPPPQAPARRTR